MHYHRTATPKSLEAVEWDITPLCDIRIGELFRNNPDLAGKYLDIDVTAIKNTLHEINPASHGSLIFKASHDYELNHEGVSIPTVAGTTRTRPLWLQRMSFGRLDNTVHVKIAVGGSSGSLPEDVKSLVTSYCEQGKYLEESLAIQALLDSRSRLDKLKRRKDPFLPLSALCKVMGVTKVESDLHSTVIHELAHAADSLQQKKDDKQALRKFYRNKVATPFYATTATVMAAGYGAETTIDPPDAITFGAQLAMWTTALYAIKGKRDEYKEFRRVERPTEARAYAMEERAHDFPTILSLKEQ